MLVSLAAPLAMPSCSTASTSAAPCASPWGTYPPFSFKQGGKLGFETELGELLAAELAGQAGIRHHQVDWHPRRLRRRQDGTSTSWVSVNEQRRAKNAW